MAQHDSDSCTSPAAAIVVSARHAKRQRLENSGSKDAAAAKQHGGLDAAELDVQQSSQGCMPPEEDAMVPSTSHLARAAGSHSQLATLDSWVPSEQTLLARRGSSSLAVAADGGDGVSAHVLPLIAVPVAQPASELVLEATVPLKSKQQQQQLPQQQQQPAGSDAAVLDGLGSSSLSRGCRRGTPRQQQPVLTEVRS